MYRIIIISALLITALTTISTTVFALEYSNESGSKSGTDFSIFSDSPITEKFVNELRDNFSFSSYQAVPSYSYNLQLALTDERAGESGSGSIDHTLTQLSSLRLEEPDWDGLKRDTYYFMAYQFAMIGILFVVPQDISGWTEQQKKDFSIGKYKDNISDVVWDKDDYFINYVLHPYWGATYFVRARERGFGNQGGFWYAVALSTAYEFGAEALFEEPSAQDLVMTPVGGALMGMWFMDVRENIKQKKREGLELSGWDRFNWLATDPLGVLNDKIDSWLGKGTYAHVQPSIGSTNGTLLTTDKNNLSLGLQFRLDW